MSDDHSQPNDIVTSPDGVNLNLWTVLSILQPLYTEKYYECWKLLAGPTVATIYALSLWCTYALSHEFSWISSIPKVLVPSLTLQLAAVAAAWKILIGDGPSTDSDTIFRFGSFFWILALYQMYSLRQNQVVGVPKSTIPYYGGKHLKGKIILVTGANSGIGRETVYQLACMGAKCVVLLCRNEKRGKQAEWDIRMKLSTQPPWEHGNDTQMVVCPCDLGDFDSIRKAVELLKKLEQVDVLINNAGVVMGTHTKSKDGYEAMMQANHLGHFLLTQLLIKEKVLNPSETSGDASTPRPPSRVINLTSSTFRLVGEEGFDFDDMFCERDRKYSMFGQYSQSKLANVLYTKELSRRYPQLLAYAVHPGIVRTNVTSNMSWYLQLPNYLFSWFVAAMQKTPTQGAYSSVYCAAATPETLPRSGSLIRNCQVDYLTTPAAESIPDAKRLWEVSEHITGLNLKKTN